MSVIVTGMEMPDTCFDCAFQKFHNLGKYVCIATPLFYPMNLANYTEGRKDFCPLVEIPTPHGRLIDADAIVYTHAIARSLDDGHNWNELCVTQNELDDAPTVIEAEGSES